MASVHVFDTPPGPTDTPPARSRAVHRAAVASLVLGVLSAATFLGWWFGVVPLLAIAAGWWALRKIQRTPEELTGENLAWTALLLTPAGYGWLWLVGANEVPAGYQQVRYQDLQPDLGQSEVVPETARQLDGKKIYLKGYMMPPRQLSRLKTFELCPDNGVCSYHTPNPTPTEVIRVTLTGDLMTEYTTTLVGVGGRLHVDEKKLYPYSMDADYLY
jgi:hypothetical protein